MVRLPEAARRALARRVLVARTAQAEAQLAEEARTLGAVPRRSARAGSARARTLRSWVAAQWPRTPMDPWSAWAPARGAVRRRVQEVAVATPAAARAAAALREDPTRAVARRTLAAVRHTVMAARRTATAHPAADRRWRRTDSVLRASQPGSVAAQREQTPEALVVRPMLEALQEAEARERVQVPAPYRAADSRAGPIARGQAPPVAAAARIEVVAAAALPTAAAQLAEARRRERPAARSVAASPAGSAPVRPAPRQLAARRKRDKTCWWADSWRHTACRRS